MMTIFRLLTLSYFLINLIILAVPVNSLAQGTITTVPPATAPVTPAPAIEMVDINAADVATLDRLLEGIGEKKAQAIVDWREKHGPFKTIYDLEQVSGIGSKTIERNKLRLMISNPETSATPAAAPASSTPPASKDPEGEDSKAELETDSESETAKKSK
jgi:competence protein ComEA